MGTGAAGAGIAWTELPDYARVGLVLAGLVAAVGLGALLRWMRRHRTGRRRREWSSGDEQMSADRPGDGDSRSGTPPRGPASSGTGGAGRGGIPAPPEHEELPLDEENPVLRVLHWIMHVATYVLAIAMVVVILEGVVSVLYTLYLSVTKPPYFMVPDIVKTFGAVLAVLIAYEIFANITLYIRSDVFPVKLVVATAVMAVARKVIILDMDEYSAMDLLGIGVLMLGLGLTYWLISHADSRSGPARSGMVGEAHAWGDDRGRH
jgi:uncharacterized membrane protein (DUF373 family)